MAVSLPMELTAPAEHCWDAAEHTQAAARLAIAFHWLNSALPHAPAVVCRSG